MTVNSLQAGRICGGNTAYQRNKSDYYPTPPEATMALMNFLHLEKNNVIWECACGQNHMVDVMRSMGYKVIGTDILTGTDFLMADVPDGVSWVITNPPFSLSEKFIRRCLEIGRPFALLLKSQYWHAKKRLDLFRENPPDYILPLSWRPDFLFKERGSGSPLMDVMWCVWYSGKADSIDSYPRYIVLDRPQNISEAAWKMK